MPSQKRGDKWSAKQYRAAQKLTRKFGHKITLSRAQTPAQRARVRRAYRALAPYAAYIESAGGKTRSPRITPIDTSKLTFERTGEHELRLVGVKGSPHVFIFKKLTRSQRAKFKGLFSPQQYAPGGVFIERPQKLRGAFRVSIEGDALVIQTGQTRDKIVALNARRLALNPEKEIKRALGRRKPRSFAVMVNGFRSYVSRPASGFFHYMSDMLERFLGEDEDNTAKDFADIFHLRLCY